MGGSKLNNNTAIQQQYANTNARYAALAKQLQDQYVANKAKDDTQYNDLNAGYNDLALTGGWSPDAISGVNGDISSLRGLEANGGLDPEAINRFRGGGVYDDLIKTGGYTDADKQNIRARATSGIPAMFDAVKNNMSANAAAQGGYSPGYSYSTAKIARDTGRGVTDAARNAEIGIDESVRSGKLAGASGMSSAENALQTLRTGNMYKGAMGAGSLTQGMTDSIRSGKEAGLAGKSNLYTSTPESNATLAQLLQVYGLNDNEINQLISLNKGTGLLDSLLPMLGYAKYFLGGGKGGGTQVGTQQPSNSDTIKQLLPGA